MRAEFSGFLRVYCETPDYVRSLEVTKQLVLAVERFLPIANIDLRPYWKVPEYDGVTLNIEGDNLPQHFEAVCSSLGTGWTDIRSERTACSAIWNASEEASFCHPLVRWANLEIFLASSIVDGTKER